MPMPDTPPSMRPDAKARAMIAALEAQSHGWDRTLPDHFTAAYRDGYRAGQEAMREQAARLSDGEASDYQALYVLEGFLDDLRCTGAAQRIARRLRAVPIEDPPQ